MTLEFYFDEECDIRYGASGDQNWRTFRDVSIKKIWSPENLPFQQTDTFGTPVRNYSARDLQLFYHRVTDVGRLAFSNSGLDTLANTNTFVGNVELPSSVTRIHEGGFYGCILMREFSGSGIRRIYRQAFRRTGVRDFHFGSDVEWIRHGWDTFMTRNTTAINIMLESVHDNFQIYDNDINTRFLNGQFALPPGTGLPVVGGRATFYVGRGQTSRMFRGSVRSNLFRYGESTVRAARVREMFIADFDLNGGITPPGFKHRQYQDAGAFSASIPSGVLDISGITNNVRPATNANPNPSDIDRTLLSMQWQSPARGSHRFLGWRNLDDSDSMNSLWTEEHFGTGTNSKGLNNATVGANGRARFRAEWEEITTGDVTVEFDLNYPNAPELPTVEVEAGLFVDRPVNPVRDGAVFRGWFLNRYGAGVPFSFMPPLFEDMTLYAWWDLETFGISYNQAWFSELPDGHPTSFNIETPTFTLPIPQRIGSVFDGWYRSAALAEEGNREDALWVLPQGTYPGGATGMGQRRMHLFARWVDAPQPGHPFNITYFLNGGINLPSAPTRYYFGRALELPIPFRANHEFMGWFSDSELLNEADWLMLDEGTRKAWFIPAGTHREREFFAKWDELPQFGSIFRLRFMFEEHGGENPPGTMNWYTFGTEHVLPTPEKEGFIFLGWHTNPRLEGFPIRVLTATTRGEMTLFPEWGDGDTVSYDIRFVLNLGTNPPNAPTSFSGDYEVVLPIPMFIGRVFLGWYTNPDFLGRPATVIPAGSMGHRTFFARWAFIESDGTFVIIFVTNGGDNPDDAPTTFTATDRSIPLPTPTRPGFRFEGWYTNEDFEGEQVFAVSQGSIGNRMFFARWEEEPVVVGCFASLSENGTTGFVVLLSLFTGAFILFLTTKKKKKT
jgi:uncharacterized repeat protein (TIGR02543 family)